MKITVKIILFCFIFTLKIFSRTNVMTNFYFQNYDAVSLLSNYQYNPAGDVIKEKEFESKGKMSRTEILYGNFENIDANILIARETENINYIISYNRFKIDSYEVRKKKVLNSALGFDYLKSGINFLLADDYMINFDFDYKYKQNGLQGNTNYNNQVKRHLFFSPQIEYSFSEKSYLKFNFEYSDLKLDNESSRESMRNNYSFFQSRIVYKRIWSSVNYIHFEFFNILDSLKVENSRNNQYACFNISDKFAVSKRFTVDATLKFNINKHYPFTLSGGFSPFFIFKNFNIQPGYEYNYDYLYCYNYINENNYFKFRSGNSPFLNHKGYLNIFINLTEFMSYNINCSYNHSDNFPEIKEDADRLYTLIPRDNINYAEIKQEVLFTIKRYMDFSFEYQTIPFTKPAVISALAKNTLSLNFALNYSLIRAGFNLKYYDYKYFIDNKNNYDIIEPVVVMDIYTKIYFTKTFGIILKAKNLTGKKIIITPNYPEMENIFNIGVIAEF